MPQSMLPVKTLPYIETGRNFCEQFPIVTILFSDIVSYTNLAARMSPLEVCHLHPPRTPPPIVRVKAPLSKGAVSGVRDVN